MNLTATRTTQLKTETYKDRKIHTYEKTMLINGRSADVFAFMDDISNMGMHMTKKSGAMLGSKLDLHWLSQEKSGPGTKYRWTGKIAGLNLDFTVHVTRWEPAKEKVWGTIGLAEMIVIDWFEMYLLTSPSPVNNTNVKLGIRYIKHKGLLGFFLGKWYSKWCVKKMLRDTAKHFNK